MPYMGWVMENLVNGKPVHGIIIAKTISVNLQYAVRAIPDVSLFEYQISFALKPVTQTAT
jgi:endonuclease